ncbi:MAG: two-component system chemotaxis response regulator CheB [bacterium]|jgi:two-component system chemotaxis response regulator CheB
MGKKIRVLVVDDSALVRQVLTEGLEEDPEFEVIGTAPDPYVARDRIVELKPDVLTLDVEMPRMDGVAFLRRLMHQHPIPVLIVSSLTERGGQVTLDALEAGAVDFATKPSLDVGYGLNEMMVEVREKLKIVAKANVSHWKYKSRPKPIKSSANQSLAQSTDKVIAIGASTGGTEAIRTVIEQFPPNMPGVVIVQHMPPEFTKRFAERLNDLCAMEVKEAETGDRVLSGRVLIAPGDKHMTVIRSGGEYRVNCKEGEKVCGHAPSVEVLFNSVAKYVGANAVGVMLTGMGKDGALGMLAMRNAKSRTLAQDEKTSVVFGMPNQAFKEGGAECLVALDKIPEKIMGLLTH